MQGFVNKAIQNFIIDTYGPTRWADVTRQSEIGLTHFESLLDYDPQISQRLLRSATMALEQPSETLLEDMGHHLVAHRRNEGLRRLLRFSGNTFEDFILSLDELPDRVRLAVEEIDLPEIEITQPETNQFLLTLGDQLPGFEWVLIGTLRALADDYGALALIDHQSGAARPQILLTLVNSNYAAGRQFDLGQSKVTLAG